MYQPVPPKSKQITVNIAQQPQQLPNDYSRDYEDPHYPPPAYPNNGLPRGTYVASGSPQPTMTGNPMMYQNYTSPQVQDMAYAGGRRFDRGPGSYYCDRCRKMVITVCSYETGTGTWLMVGILFLFGFCLCCCIPFCLDDCKDCVHTCPDCRSLLGVSKFMNS